MSVRRWPNWVTSLVYFNAAWNLFLFAVNPALGSLVLAWICMIVGATSTFSKRRDRRRLQASTQRHSFLFGGPVGTRPVLLGPNESLTALPNGWSRLETAHSTRYIKQCSHWPRDEVALADGSVVAYICRRCGQDWANEEWVTMKGVEW